MFKIIISTVAILFSNFAYCGDGSALIPHWIKGDGVDTLNYSTIHISNVSGSAVTVKVTLFDMNGNAYDESSETGVNFQTATFVGDPLSSSGGTLESNQTGFIWIKPDGAGKRGYGVISWQTSGNERVAITAHVDKVWAEKDSNGAHRDVALQSYPVNQYAPF